MPPLSRQAEIELADDEDELRREGDLPMTDPQQKKERRDPDRSTDPDQGAYRTAQGPTLPCGSVGPSTASVFQESEDSGWSFLWKQN
jgi:hypothetical protein